MTVGVRVPAVVRRRMMIPEREMRFEFRGFRRDDAVLRERLEGICRALLAGFNPALEEDEPEPLESINRLAPELRGFAYEGAATACTVLDVVGLSRGSRLATLQDSAGGRAYPQLIHIGVGLALANLRLPGWGGLRGLDPLGRWMALDGRGFWGSFFHPTKYLATKRTERVRPGPAAQVMDQGVGRSLWFVECADVGAIAERVATFHPSRHADLWSGVGLAACYAGGADDAGLARIVQLSGAHRAQLAPAAAAAARAGVICGVMPAHTTEAVKAFTGVDPATAAEWELSAIRKLGDGAGTVADYQRMRALIRGTWAASAPERVGERA